MSRIDKLISELTSKEIEGVVILSDFNRRYLSGFTGTSGALIITENDKRLITDFRYIDQATRQAPDFEIVNQQETPTNEILNQFKQLNIKNIGFEGNLLSYDMYEALNQSQTRLTSVSGLVEKIREVKDASEIEIIQKAAEIVDETFEYILTVATAGMTEQQLKAKLESKMLELGAEGTSFDTIVASGYRGALPHGVASDKVIEKGDMITLDFGAYYKGYASDITRTFAIGEPDPKMKEIYQIVLDANEKAIEAIKPGMTGKQLDAIARDYIAEKGYGELFGHSLGHGIGLDVHEGPMLSKRFENELTINNCVTIEPGIYVEGLGGVRIEDDVLVTENGCQRFTKSSKNLIIL
ncbi:MULTISPECIES: M24 family metallopeptidase [Staphylococcus]|uniref:Aminopeptidase P family protein n=1 Tax=Staphylococcus hsinchuensis TaxID=3051183 RepID=A0ABZ3ECC8_9STAP|nr:MULTISPECIES: aminopeptidase P family protein [unclassified Staphylococcus]